MNAITKEKISEVFCLAGVPDFKGLSRVYGEKDQELMRTFSWDDESSHLVTNQVKGILEEIDPAELNKNDRMLRRRILWFWYHHAISCAIWKRKDKPLAQFYATKALEFQPRSHPNKITQLLWFLVHDRLAEAKSWIEKEDFVRYQLVTARKLVKEYERGKLFV